MTIVFLGMLTVQGRDLQFGDCPHPEEVYNRRQNEAPQTHQGIISGHKHTTAVFPFTRTYLYLHMYVCAYVCKYMHLSCLYNAYMYSPDM